MRTALYAVLAASALAQPQAPGDVLAWRAWEDIGPAIAPAPLDGPDEVLEKAEIIADRKDDLVRELGRITPRCEAVRARLDGARQQLRAARELSELRGGRDLQLRQRMHDLRDRRRGLELSAGACTESLAGLDQEIARLAERHSAYLTQAAGLRAEEGETP